MIKPASVIQMTPLQMMQARWGARLSSLVREAGQPLCKGGDGGAAAGMREGQAVPLEETAGPPAEELAAQVEEAVKGRLAELASLAGGMVPDAAR